MRQPDDLDDMPFVPTPDDIIREFERLNFKHVNDTVHPVGRLTVDYCNAVVDMAVENQKLREALEFAYAHLESMDNYSLVGSARHYMKQALEGKNE